MSACRVVMILDAREHCQVEPELGACGSNPERMIDAWEHAEFWMKELTNPCFVYVVQSGTAIKVGKATNVYERVATLQCGNPVTLELLHALPGDYELESRLHRDLRPHRIRNEWFDGPACEKTLQFIGDLAEKLLAAHDGGDTAPEWRGLMTWPRASLAARRARSKPAAITVRHVEPDPVPPEVRQQRYRDYWLTPRRPGERLGG